LYVCVCVRVYVSMRDSMLGAEGDGGLDTRNVGKWLCA